MSQGRSAAPSFHIDVSASSSTTAEPEMLAPPGRELAWLMRQLIAGQEKTNALLDDMRQHLGAAQRQRQQELANWRQQNPELAQGCRVAAEALSKVQTEFLHRMTEDVNENIEGLIDGDFVLSEFVDRFGPRLAHLNGVLQVLSQLGSVPQPTEAQ